MRLCDLTPAGALGNLCHSRPVYEACRPDVQPYVNERVSWPPAASVPSHMLDGLPADLSWLRLWERRFLCTPGDAAKERLLTGLTEPYVDPVLENHPVEYGDFLLTSEAADVLTWRMSDGSPGDFGV